MAEMPLFDRGHLAVQTDGDAALADELLGLFRAQCRRILSDMADASLPPDTRADLLHTLKGSALGIGAARLAACAAEAEHRVRAGGTAPAESLEPCVRETLAAIGPPR